MSSQKTKSDEEVVAEHDAQHGAHEGEQRDLESSGVGVLLEVRAAYSTINVPMPVISIANNTLRPSR